VYYQSTGFVLWDAEKSVFLQMTSSNEEMKLGKEGT